MLRLRDGSRSEAYLAIRKLWPPRSSSVSYFALERAADELEAVESGHVVDVREASQEKGRYPGLEPDRVELEINVADAA